ncbi:MAG: nucleotidyl transferase AbiEii/AbiGii toxin family protein [Candidatus Margulisbacteria bacterium]|nr:nucleotidyl transferase AbiEii/AbiGii toxin family protein [Candidatus Margulisiibacteriota bacterium]
MLHKNKEEFLKVLENTSAQTGFPLTLLEKDYYITILLSDINNLSKKLIFKGGTCLNKIYYSYYRLSEDIDFSMKLPSGVINRTKRKNTIKPVKEGVQSFVKKYGLKIQDADSYGHNESKQYIYYIEYNSAVLESTQTIKLEIGLRFNPILPVTEQSVSHKFVHPFTKEPLFKGGKLYCLDLKELIAEKMRATATRMNIAPRDFYDLGYLIKVGFDFKDKAVWGLFKQKLKEDGFDDNITKYKENMGRSEKDIKDMESRIEAELLDVLTPAEKKTFSIEHTLKSINGIFKSAG